MLNLRKRFFSIPCRLDTIAFRNENITEDIQKLEIVVHQKDILLNHEKTCIVKRPEMVVLWRGFETYLVFRHNSSSARIAPNSA